LPEKNDTPVGMDQVIFEGTVSGARLKMLCEISTSCANFDKFDSSLSEIFIFLARVVPLKSIVLVEKKGSAQKTHLWVNSNINQQIIGETIERSKNSYEYLVNTFVPDVIVNHPSIDMPLPWVLKEAEKISPDQTSKFITLPLVLNPLENFGIIQFEIWGTINKDDLHYLGAITNLLSVSLDRYFKNLATHNEDLADLNIKNADLASTRNYAHSLELERQLRDQFVSILTHDLRTPLTSVKLAAQIILRRPDEKEKIQMLSSQIVKNINRMDEMIRDLLDVNRLRAGESLAFTMSKCDIHHIAYEVLKDLSNTYGNRFLLHSSNKNLSGFWNEEAIRRLMENLINNAVKYGAVNELIMFTIKKLGKEVEFIVHNEGNPISAEDQVNLFKPFSRSASAKKNGKKGWGLGLTLVEGVARAHGGKVAVQSDQIYGTSFIITLPLDSRPFQILN
jgi:signal transduction histidine kinase